MLVCHCKRLSEREIRDAIQSGARTRSSLSRACGAGSGCGGCVPAVDQLLQTERRQPAPLEPAPPLANAAG